MGCADAGIHPGTHASPCASCVCLQTNEVSKSHHFHTREFLSYDSHGGKNSTGVRGAALPEAQTRPLPGVDTRVVLREDTCAGNPDGDRRKRMAWKPSGLYDTTRQFGRQFSVNLLDHMPTERDPGARHVAKSNLDALWGWIALAIDGTQRRSVKNREVHLGYLVTLRFQSLRNEAIDRVAARVAVKSIYQPATVSEAVGTRTAVFLLDFT